MPGRRPFVTTKNLVPYQVNGMHLFSGLGGSGLGMWKGGSWVRSSSLPASGKEVWTQGGVFSSTDKS